MFFAKPELRMAIGGVPGSTELAVLLGHVLPPQRSKKMGESALCAALNPPQVFMTITLTTARLEMSTTSTSSPHIFRKTDLDARRRASSLNSSDVNALWTLIDLAIVLGAASHKDIRCR